MSHVFLSYVKEDFDMAQLIALTLKGYGVDVWLDRSKLRAGSRYKHDIRSAIQSGDFFIAFFSKAWATRERSYVNEELTQAIEVLRQRPSDRTWFIPVRLNECEIPDRSIGAGETLRDLQRVDMFPDWLDGLNQIGKVIVPDKFSDDVSIEETVEGAVITGNHVRLSSAESEVLFSRYIKYFKKYAKKYGTFEYAHHLGVLWAFRETYNWFDEDEIKKGTSELARKLGLFNTYTLRMNFQVDLDTFKNNPRRPSTKKAKSAKALRGS